MIDTTPIFKLTQWHSCLYGFPTCQPHSVGEKDAIKTTTIEASTKAIKWHFP